MDWVQEGLRKIIKRLRLYMVRSRLTNKVRIVSTQLRRLNLKRARHSGDSKSTTSLTATESRIQINICVPNLYYGNHYPRRLARVFDCRFLVKEYFPSADEASIRRRLKNIDVFHLHFLDQLQLDYPQTIQLIGHLRANQIKIVVTAHDLTPHSKRPEYYDPLYQAWLSAADGIIHHSEWGAEALRARYKVPEETKNAMVLNLGRSDMTRVTTPTERAAIEAALGLAKVPIRIGIVGTPRKEKLVVEFLEGFARTIRDDMQITCWSLAEHEVVPDDRRIAIAERYRPVSNRTFRKRLAVCDVIAIPYQSDGEMLTTGLTGSAMEVGIGILRTDWPFLEEVFGDAGIYVGNDVESFAAGLSRLTIDEIRLAQEASLELRRSHSWRTMAEEYGKFYDSVLAG